MLYRNSTYLESFFDSYLFGKNIQGDILYIYDKNGNRLVSYTYDAWGNILSTVYSNGGASTSARFNPLRYRGYYYDTETGLYYLNSRYYDSVAGRFINADEIINGNGDILGYNLFAYCSNNPVMFDDFSGQGFTTWLKNRWDDVKQVAKKTYDFITNDNENVVLNAKHIAFYKGKLVVKLPIGGNAASFGIIFLGDDVAQRGDAVETVKHEYGHTKQFFSMGILGYAVCVAVPSISCNLLDRMNLLQYDYYSSPWEYDADMYGGVNRGNYESWADVVNKIYKSFVNIVMFAES